MRSRFSKDALRAVVGLCALAAAAALQAEAVEQAAEACTWFTEIDPETLADTALESDALSEIELPAGQQRYRLGEITVVRQNVFEREENWLHRAANRYHVRTRERVVLSVLPMRSGEMVNRRLLAEAERILRSKVYLYDARVVPQRLCGDRLDILVITRDVWTLDPQLALYRSGGENDVGFGISDNNLLGTGKALSIGFEKDKDRRGVNLAYSDPNIAHSRWAADLFVVDNNDGERFAVNLQYPFYSLDSRYAFQMASDQFSRSEGLYFLSDEFWEYQTDTRSLRLAGGWSRGLRDRFVDRYLVGYAYEDYEFDLPAAFASGFPAASLPDRRFGYPFVAYQRIEDDYDKRVNLDRVQRTEDVALGSRLSAELGYSGRSTGGDGDHLIGRFSYVDAAWLTPTQLISYGAWLGGYYDVEDHSGENVTAEALVAYRNSHADAWSLLVRGTVAASWNPTLDRQLLLGGELGLRGYPNRYQTGDRRFLLTVEERYYSNIYPLRMFRLGGALFFDVGRAWYEGEVPAWLPDDREGGHFGVLSNVGLGLRLESTRTRGDRIIHLDVAFPLRSGPAVRGVEVTLSAKQTL